MKPKDYPYELLEEKVKNTSVRIVSVAHTLDFFLEHKHFLDNQIKESDAIMLEGNYYTLEECYSLFRNLGDIARRENKKVYQADPRTKKTGCLDFLQTGLGLYMALSTKLLDHSYGVPLGLYLLSGSLVGMLIRHIPRVISDIKKNKPVSVSNNYEALLYGETDYANIMIAEGVSKIISSIKDVKKLACFHGQAHSKPIQVYLRYPAFRKFKRLLYLPTYDYVSNRKVREYTPINEGWELSKKF